MKKFNQLFDEHTGEGIRKWSNYGDIYDKHFAPHRDQQIKLSSNEIKILKLLIYNSNQYLTRDLLNNELGLDYLSRSGDMQISRLRQKLKNECNLNDIIRSIHGKGYKIFI